MKRYFLLALVAFVPVVVSFGSGCKKTVPTVEAGVDTAALTADAEPPAATAEADAAPAATLSAAKTVAVPVKSAAPKEGGPWQASYTCYGGMTLSQQGNNVSGRLKPADSKDFSTITCVANGDSCDGAANVFKDAKPAGQKHFTMKRAANGDITYKGDGEPTTLCHKK